MGSLSRYSKLVIDHKLRQIAEIVVRINRSPFKTILEAAMVVDVPIETVSGVLNEVAVSVLNETPAKHNWRKGIGQGASDYDDYMRDAYKKYVASLDQQARQAQPAAPAAKPVVAPMARAVDGSVDQLTSMLKEIVQKLSDKHGLGDEQITQLFNQALKALRTTDVGAGIGSPTIPLKGFTAPPDNTGAYTPFSADTGSYAGAGDFGQSFSFGSGDDGEAEPSEEEMEKFIQPHMAGKVRMLKGNPRYKDWLRSQYRHYKDLVKSDEPPEEEKPAWFNKMTNAERTWFDSLKKKNPKAAEQFINRVNASEKEDLRTGSEDWKQANAIADKTSKRNPWMKDKDATFKAAAGLWKRHKVRQDLARLYGKGGDWEGEAEPVGDFDDLLQKDHRKNTGEILNEWRRLAGIKEEKPKKRSR